MDITPLFKACVKTVKTRKRNLNKPSDILNKNSKRYNVISKASIIVKEISKLQDFLLQNKKSYVNFSTFISDNDKMNEVEREQIDKTAQTIINKCKIMISEFKNETLKIKGSLQILEHRDNVLKLLNNYLQSVCKIYSQQKAVRIKRTLELHKMSKMDSGQGKNFVQEQDESVRAARDISRNLEPATTNEDVPSAEEMQMFEAENEQLYAELNSLDEEVRQIESKVVHISELQRVFTEKVLDQEHDIDRISATVVGATENVRDANDQIRQAIRRNAGLRVYVLFFIIVITLSLLFLDWYND